VALRASLEPAEHTRHQTQAIALLPILRVTLASKGAGFDIL